MTTLIRSLVIPHNETQFALIEHKLCIENLKEKIFSHFNTTVNDTFKSDPCLGLGIKKKTRLLPAGKGNYIFTEIQIIVCRHSITLALAEYEWFYQVFFESARQLIESNELAIFLSVSFRTTDTAI